MAKEYEYLDDYTVGERFISPARTITEADIVNFAGITGDWHPLHTDVEYAAQTPYRERIAHGMLTLSIGMVLPFRLVGHSSFIPTSFIAFYGMDNVRFMAPTRIGDTIHCEVEVTEITNKGKSSGVLTTQNQIKNQKGEVLVSYEIKVVRDKRP
jgi:acyl dehydratase